MTAVLLVMSAVLIRKGIRSLGREHPFRLSLEADIL